MSATPPAVKHPKVFCSHRQCDKPRVREIATKLRGAGIDAWLDQWEIKPGDDFVAAINEGLASYDVGLIFFSNEVEHGKWVQAEISVLTVGAIEDGKAVIPVMLEPEVPVPPLLRSRSRLGYEQLDQLIDAIYGRTGKPALGAPLQAAEQRSFVIKLQQKEQGEVGVSAELDGKPTVAEQTVRISADLAFSYAEFLRSRLPGARLGAEAVRTERESDLQKLGDAVGQLLFPQAVEAAFLEVADEATKNNAQVELIVETAAPELLAIPFEAARLKNGRTPALESGVRMARRLAGLNAKAPDPQPGPLKVLVAVGAPDEGKTANVVLDMERELQSILDAVEDARKYGNAYVRILDVGSLDEIRASLAEQHYHVLHLSGHGNAGVLELEDEDGNPVQTTAKDIAEAIRDSGKPSPLVFLASCLSGAGDSDTASLAHALLQQGVPAVLAMQTSVTDHYSTELAKAFYTNLSKGDRPQVSQALALARQEVERDRRKAVTQGKHFPAEYATPSLFFAGEEQPLLDRRLELAPPIQQTKKPASGSVPMLSIGELVGRRVELRRVMRVLTDDERSVSEIGQKAGVQILGIGGVGKSAIAGRAMARLADEGWTCVAVTGNWTLSGLAAALCAAVITQTDAQLQAIGQKLGENLADNVRLQLITALLANYPVLLVLDNFEDNLKLKPGGAEYLDAASAQVMQWLYQAAQRGKVAITCRYPVPEADDWLATEAPGPLSPAQTGKLMLRLGALSQQDPESLRLVQRTIGGHPRMLQYLDAILKKGKGVRVADVARRLREQAKKQGLDLEKASGSLQEAMQVALDVGAGDILLDELVELAGREGDLQVLQQASVFPSPASVEGLAFCLAEGKAAAPAEVKSARDASERLSQLSLLTRVADDHVWVHRWTAEALSERTPEETYHRCCRLAGEFLTSTKHSVVQGLEATRLFLAAHEFDRAADEGERLVNFLRTYGQAADVATVAGEVAPGLPPDHERHYYFLGNEADALLQLGLTKEALSKTQSVMRSLENRAEANPDRADFLRELSVSYERMGDLRRGLGQGEQARRYYQKSLENWERLIRQEPDSTDYLRGVCVPYDRMGDLLRGLGQGEQARRYFQKSLEIAERLARQEPDRADFLRDLSISYERMGDLLRGLGQGEQAHLYFQKSLEIRERLARQEPDRAEFQRDLSVSCNKMGDLMRGLGQGEQARLYFQKSLEIRERLARQEPDRADFLRDLSISYLNMGDLMRGLGQGEQARLYFQKSLEIFERLTRQEPDRADFLHDLSLSYERMGDLMLGLGQGEQARLYLQKSLEIRERLARQEPDRADFLRDLSVSYNKMGDLMLGLGQGEQARLYYQKALDIAERLARQEPDRADFLRDLSVSYNKMGDLMLGLGQGEQARLYFQKSLEIRERLAHQEPDRADFRADLVTALVRLGDLPSLERAVAIAKRLEAEQKLTAEQREWVPRLEAALRDLGG